MKCLGKLKLKSLLWGSLQHSEIYFAIALLCNLTLTVGVVTPPTTARAGKIPLQFLPNSLLTKCFINHNFYG